MDSHFKVNVIVCIFVLLSNGYATEWFSSLGQMEDLIHDEVDLLASLEKHIESETVRLDKLKKMASSFQKISDHANTDIESYLSHPVDQYRLVKRLAVEWQSIEDLVRNASDFVTELQQKQLNFPTNDDVVGTAEALMRLQDTYKLDTHLLAAGDVKGRKANESLTAEDCYQIGRTAYLNEDFYHCKLWMKEVMVRNKKTYQSFSSFDVLDHLSFCTARLGDILGAADLSIQMLQLDPNNERILNNYRYYESLLAANKKGDEDMDNHKPKNDPGAGTFERGEYEELCRGEGIEVSKAMEKKLKCYYWNNHRHPRLILKPLKMEELYTLPHIVFFHEFVSDTEMVEIKRIAKPKLNRATVQNPLTGKLEHAKYRVSKSTWLEEHEGDKKTVAAVNQRIGDATGLSMSTAEMLQIANYGVGGQYEPHYDCARIEDAGQFEEAIGNRIATLLIYMTDVAEGGYTVFLPPKIAVKPEKGGAAFWHNLYPSGDVDLRTRHAACPVLTGIKWVSNKWIHERDQEFKRKCGLRRKDENRFF